MRALPRHAPLSLARRAFTLVEILIAMLIVGLVMIAVATVLRTAMRSWQIGHDITEIVQTARITQDVVLRDMNNIVYLPSNRYNQNFQRGLVTAAQQFQQDYDAGAAIIPDERYEWETLTPPVDLTFTLTDGGDKDQLTFIRAHQSRYPGDPNTWGLRRVTYYVEGRTLFRREDDPYGFRLDPMNESFFNPHAQGTIEALAGYFMKPEAAAAETNFLPVAASELMLPGGYQIAEPLCEGVEFFNVVAGYFKEGQWREVTGWDSNARQYRQPPQINEIENEDVLRAAMQTFPDRIRYDGRGVPSLIQNRGQPDDLPGYVAIQVGVRGPNAKGRLHSFTFFHSLPMGEERDVLLLDEDGQIISVDAEFSPRRGRGNRGRNSRGSGSPW